MPSWNDVPDEIKKRFPAPPERDKFDSQDEYEEALGYWQSRVGRNIGLVMQQREASEKRMEIYTCYSPDEADLFRSIKRRAMGPWAFLASGEWSQSPYHQGSRKFYIRSSKDRGYWALLSIGFPSRIIAVAHAEQDAALELVGARMLQASQLAGGDYIDMLDDHGDFDADRFWALYESSSEDYAAR